MVWEVVHTYCYYVVLLWAPKTLSAHFPVSVVMGKLLAGVRGDKPCASKEILSTCI